jgi:hypothetical protein
MKLDFPWQIFEKILKYQIQRKSAPLGYWLFHAERTDRWTGMMKLTVAFASLQTRLKTFPISTTVNS